MVNSLRRYKPRGVAFLSVLMVTVLTLMMITAALILLPSGRAFGAATQQEQMAKAAAQAGIEYAYTQLHDDVDWRGDANRVVIDIPNEMWVREDQGNIVGILYGPNGTRSMFRMRFNHQNNMDSPTENLPDPAADMRISHKFVSVNNLDSFGTVPLFRATGSGYSVPALASPTGDVPGSTAVLYAEGIAGPALRDISPTNLTPDPTAGPVTARVVETYIGNDTEAYGSSVMYGADDIDFDLTGTLAMISLDGTATSQAATLGSMRVNSTDPSPLSMTNGGDVYVEPSVGRFLINGTDSTAPTATQQDTSSSFVQLGWGDIAQPGSTDPRMRAGTYVWQDTSPPTLAYYAEEYDPATFPTTAPLDTDVTPAELTDDGTGIAMDPVNLRLDISKNIQVEATGGATGLAIIPDANVMSTLSTRPKTRLLPASPTAPAPILASAGDIQLKGAIAGQGSLTTQGSIVVQGTSVMESQPDSEVALFAKQDITIDAIPPEALPSLGGAGGGAAALLPAAPGAPVPATTAPTTTPATAPATAPTTTAAAAAAAPAAPVAPVAPTVPTAATAPTAPAAPIAPPASSFVSSMGAPVPASAPSASLTVAPLPAPAAPGTMVVGPAPAAPVVVTSVAGPAGPAGPFPSVIMPTGATSASFPAVGPAVTSGTPLGTPSGSASLVPALGTPATPATGVVAPPASAPLGAPAPPAPGAPGPPALGAPALGAPGAPALGAPGAPALGAPGPPALGSAGSVGSVGSVGSGPAAPAPGAPGAPAIVAGGFTVGTPYWNGVIGGETWGTGGTPPWLGPDPGFGLAKAEDVAFVGVVYAQGDFKVNLNPPGAGGRGNFLMRGILVAYGGDYEPGSANAPGSDFGKGKIEIQADNVGMTHDSSFISHLSNPTSPPLLRVVSWRGF